MFPLWIHRQSMVGLVLLRLLDICPAFYQYRAGKLFVNSSRRVLCGLRMLGHMVHGMKTRGFKNTMPGGCESGLLGESRDSVSQGHKMRKDQQIFAWRTVKKRCIFGDCISWMINLYCQYSANLKLAPTSSTRHKKILWKKWLSRVLNHCWVHGKKNMWAILLKVSRGQQSLLWNPTDILEYDFTLTSKMVRARKVSGPMCFSSRNGK